MARSSSITAELTPTQVMTRFGVRTAILMLFAGFGTIGFGRSLAALLWMTIILCAVIGTLRRE